MVIKKSIMLLTEAHLSTVLSQYVAVPAQPSFHLYMLKGGTGYRPTSVSDRLSCNGETQHFHWSHHSGKC